MHKWTEPIRILGLFAMGFGVLTIVSGTGAFLGAVDMGAVVPFVLWFNTLAGVVYVAAGTAILQGYRWDIVMVVGIFAATMLVSGAFGLHVLTGGDFEMRTVFALGFRCLVWGTIALFMLKSREIV